MGIDTNVKIIGKLDVDQLVTFIKEEISESITTSLMSRTQITCLTRKLSNFPILKCLKLIQAFFVLFCLYGL